MSQNLIIAVDDDSKMLVALCRLLQAHEYAVQAFSSVSDFLNDADLDSANCLILDIHLDGASGIELRRLIAGNGFTIPVIFITADATDILRNEANAAGCAAFLRKPISSNALIGAIQTCVKSRVTVG